MAEAGVEFGLQVGQLDPRLMGEFAKITGDNQGLDALKLLGRPDYFQREVSNAEIYFTVVGERLGLSWKNHLKKVVDSGRRLLEPTSLRLYSLNRHGMHRLDYCLEEGQEFLPFNRRRVVADFAAKEGNSAAVSALERACAVKVASGYKLISALWPQEMAMLRVLVEAYPRLAFYNDISQELWGDELLPKNCSDPLLLRMRFCASDLRQVLKGVGAQTGQFDIETSYGEGHSLVWRESK